MAEAAVKRRKSRSFSGGEVSHRETVTEEEEIIFIGGVKLSDKELLSFVENTVTMCCHLVSKLTGKSLPVHKYLPTERKINVDKMKLIYVNDGKCVSPNFEYRGQFLFVENNNQVITFPVEADVKVEHCSGDVGHEVVTEATMPITEFDGDIHNVADVIIEEPKIDLLEEVFRETFDDAFDKMSDDSADYLEVEPVVKVKPGAEVEYEDDEESIPDAGEVEDESDSDYVPSDGEVRDAEGDAVSMADSDMDVNSIEAAEENLIKTCSKLESEETVVGADVYLPSDMSTIEAVCSGQFDHAYYSPEKVAKGSSVFVDNDTVVEKLDLDGDVAKPVEVDHEALKKGTEEILQVALSLRNQLKANIAPPCCREELPPLAMDDFMSETDEGDRNYGKDESGGNVPVSSNSENVEDLSQKVSEKSEKENKKKRRKEIASENEREKKKIKIELEKSGIGSEKSGIGSEKSVLWSEKSVLGSEKSVLGSEKSVLGSEKSVLWSEKSALGSEKSVLGSEKSVLGSEKSVLWSEKSVLWSEKSDSGGSKMCGAMPEIGSNSKIERKKAGSRDELLKNAQTKADMKYKIRVQRGGEKFESHVRKEKDGSPVDDDGENLKDINMEDLALCETSGSLKPISKTELASAGGEEDNDYVKSEVNVAMDFKNAEVPEISNAPTDMVMRDVTQESLGEMVSSEVPTDTHEVMTDVPTDTHEVMNDQGGLSKLSGGTLDEIVSAEQRNRSPIKKEKLALASALNLGLVNNNVELEGEGNVKANAKQGGDNSEVSFLDLKETASKTRKYKPYMNAKIKKIKKPIELTTTMTSSGRQIKKPDRLLMSNKPENLRRQQKSKEAATDGNIPETNKKIRRRLPSEPEHLEMHFRKYFQNDCDTVIPNEGELDMVGRSINFDGKSCMLNYGKGVKMIGPHPLSGPHSLSMTEVKSLKGEAPPWWMPVKVECAECRNLKLLDDVKCEDRETTVVAPNSVENLKSNDVMISGDEEETWTGEASKSVNDTNERVSGTNLGTMLTVDQLSMHMEANHYSWVYYCKYTPHCPKIFFDKGACIEHSNEHRCAICRYFFYDIGTHRKEHKFSEMRSGYKWLKTSKPQINSGIYTYTSLLKKLTSGEPDESLRPEEVYVCGFGGLCPKTFCSLKLLYSHIQISHMCGECGSIFFKQPPSKELNHGKPEKCHYCKKESPEGKLVQTSAFGYNAPSKELSVSNVLCPIIRSGVLWPVSHHKVEVNQEAKDIEKPSKKQAECQISQPAHLSCLSGAMSASADEDVDSFVIPVAPKVVFSLEDEDEIDGLAISDEVGVVLLKKRTDLDLAEFTDVTNIEGEVEGEVIDFKLNGEVQTLKYLRGVLLQEVFGLSPKTLLNIILVFDSADEPKLGKSTCHSFEIAKTLGAMIRNRSVCDVDRKWDRVVLDVMSSSDERWFLCSARVFDTFFMNGYLALFLAQGQGFLTPQMGVVWGPSEAQNITEMLELSANNSSAVTIPVSNDPAYFFAKLRYSCLSVLVRIDNEQKSVAAFAAKLDGSIAKNLPTKARRKSIINVWTKESNAEFINSSVLTETFGDKLSKLLVNTNAKDGSTFVTMSKIETMIICKLEPQALDDIAKQGLFKGVSSSGELNPGQHSSKHVQRFMKSYAELELQTESGTLKCSAMKCKLSLPKFGLPAGAPIYVVLFVRNKEEVRSPRDGYVAWLLFGERLFRTFLNFTLEKVRKVKTEYNILMCYPEDFDLLFKNFLQLTFMDPRTDGQPDNLLSHFNQIVPVSKAPDNFRISAIKGKGVVIPADLKTFYFNMAYRQIEARDIYGKEYLFHGLQISFMKDQSTFENIYVVICANTIGYLKDPSMDIIRSVFGIDAGSKLVNLCDVPVHCIPYTNRPSTHLVMDLDSFQNFLAKSQTFAMNLLNVPTTKLEDLDMNHDSNIMISLLKGHDIPASSVQDQIWAQNVLSHVWIPIEVHKYKSGKANSLCHGLVFRLKRPLFGLGRNCSVTLLLMRQPGDEDTTLLSDLYGDKGPSYLNPEELFVYQHAPPTVLTDTGYYVVLTPSQFDKIHKLGLLEFPEKQTLDFPLKSNSRLFDANLQNQNRFKGTPLRFFISYTMDELLMPNPTFKHVMKRMIRPYKSDQMHVELGVFDKSWPNQEMTQSDAFEKRRPQPFKQQAGCKVYGTCILPHLVPGSDIFQCYKKDCGYKTEDGLSFWLHLKFVHVEKKLFLRCVACDEEFSRQIALTEHIKAHVSDPMTIAKKVLVNLLDSTEADNAPKQLQELNICMQCGECLGDRGQLNEHLNRHAQMVWPCQDCERRFPDRKALLVHFNWFHDPEKLNACECCLMRFHRYSSLILHRERFHRPESEVEELTSSDRCSATDLSSSSELS